MKSTLTIILLMICSQLFSQIRDVDAIYTNEYHKNMTWAIQNDEYLLIEKQQYRRTNTWEIMHRKKYKYDSNNNMTEEIQQGLSGSNWVNDYRLLWIYDSESNKIEEWWQLWYDSAWGAWIEGNPVFFPGRFSQRTLFIYDANNNCVEHLHQNTDSVDYRRDLYSYDSNGYTTGHLLQIRDNNSWIDYYRHNLFTYDENKNLIYVLGQAYSNSIWVDQWTYIYEYDEYQNRTEYIGSYWDQSSEEWVYSANYLYTYDEYHNLKEDLRRDWTGNKWKDAYLGKYFYEKITDIDNKTTIINDFWLSNNFPNPFNNGCMIKYLIPEQSQVELKVFDVLGREVAELVNRPQSSGAYEVQFDASHLGSGVYFYKLKAGNFVQSKKMVLLK